MFKVYSYTLAAEIQLKFSWEVKSLYPSLQNQLKKVWQQVHIVISNFRQTLCKHRQFCCEISYIFWNSYWSKETLYNHRKQLFGHLLYRAKFARCNKYYVGLKVGLKYFKIIVLRTTIIKFFHSRLFSAELIAFL